MELDQATAKTLLEQLALMVEQVTKLINTVDELERQANEQAAEIDRAIQELYGKIDNRVKVLVERLLTEAYEGERSDYGFTKTTNSR